MPNALFNLFSGGFGYLGSFFRHTSVFRKAFRVALFAYFSCGLNYGETETVESYRLIIRWFRIGSLRFEEARFWKSLSLKRIAITTLAGKAMDLFD